MTFTWACTFPNTHYDFVAEEAGQHVDRIKRVGGLEHQWWAWTATGVQRGHQTEGMRPLNGMAPIIKGHSNASR